MKYVLELLRGSTVCNSKTEAVRSLDNYQHHRPGQPVVVLYKKGDSKRAVFAIGTETGTGDKGGGKKRYVIIGDCDGSHEITSTLSADNILLREIDFTALISEGGPGQFDDYTPLATNYPGHFGFLNVEGAAFTTNIPANTTVQAAFEGILTGVLSPKPIVDVEVEGTVLAHHDDTTSGTITIDITEEQQSGSYDIIFTITNWDDVGGRITSMYYIDETGAKTTFPQAASKTFNFPYGGTTPSGTHTYTLYAEVSGSSLAQRIGTATVVINNQLQPEPEKYTYTLTYDGNEPDGTATGIPPQASYETAEEHHIFTLSSATPTLAGYIFRGWSKTEAGTTPETAITATAANPDVTVYAIWEPVQPTVQYTITYHSNNGEDKTDEATTANPSGYSLPDVSVFGWTKTGYGFKGWSKTVSGAIIEHISESDFIDRHLDLHAIWQINTYNLTGSVKDKDGNLVAGSSVAFTPASTVPYSTEVTATASVPSGYTVESVTVNGAAATLSGNSVTFTVTRDTTVVFTASEDSVYYYWSSEDIANELKSKQLSDWTLFTDTHYIQEGEKLVGKYNCVLTPSTVTSVTGKVTTSIESPLVFSDYSEKTLGIAILNTTGLSNYKVWCSPQSTDKDTFGAKKIEINIS